MWKSHKNGIFGVNLDEDQPSNGIFGSPYPTSRFETNTEPGCLMVLPAFSILNLKFSISGTCILEKCFFSPDGSAHDQADRQDGVHPLLAWAIETINFCWSFLSINNHYFLLHFSATTSFTSTSICIIYYFYYISLPVLVLMKSLPAIMQTREAWTIWTRLYNCQMLQLATAILWISSPFILCL